jgi:ATP-binding cassette, subfamily F, member 2
MSSLAKQKRKAERAAKAAAKNSSKSGTSTPCTGAETPISVTGETSLEEVTAQLNGTHLAGGGAVEHDAERSAVGVLASQDQSRDIKIEQFSLSFHGRVLIENATIELNYGQRYGLLGANGSGKSTFLATLAAREVPIPDHIDVYLLKEEAEPSDLNALEYILLEAKKKVDKLENEIEKMSMDPENLDEVALQGLYDRLEEMDPNTFESKAASILNGLGFTTEMMRKPTRDMSGGWRMRVTLGQALFIKPLLLLLDEPTNHLDLEAVVWLEAYLSKYPHCLVLTSHSQDFLNNVCSQVMDLTVDRKLVYYGGNYDTYVRTKDELETNQTKAYYKQQDEIAHIKKFIASAGTYVLWH